MLQIVYHMSCPLSSPSQLLKRKCFCAGLAKYVLAFCGSSASTFKLRGTRPSSIAWSTPSLPHSHRKRQKPTSAQARSRRCPPENSARDCTPAVQPGRLKPHVPAVRLAMRLSGSSSYAGSYPCNLPLPMSGGSPPPPHPRLTLPAAVALCTPGSQ